jgi:tetratricopeptide (TPR) repeat protein
MSIRHWVLIACLWMLPCWAEQPRALDAGIALVGAGDYAAAVAALAPLVPDNPKDSVLHYWLGRAYFGQRAFRLAAQHLAVAAERDARNRDVAVWYGQALRAAGRLREALEVYADYRARFPDDAVLLGDYAATQALAGDYAGARASFQALAKMDPASKNTVNDWLRVLDGLSQQARLEPPLLQRTNTFTFYGDARDPAGTWVLDEVDKARGEVSNALGVRVRNFRVLLFSDWEAYRRYAHIYLPDDGNLHAVAFTIKGTLVIWSPTAWRERGDHRAELVSTVRHELAHLAIAQRTEGQGVPLWLNEGLACVIGGSGGLQTGAPPVPPFALPRLDAAFQSPDVNRVEQAYAQAHAMATVLLATLGREPLLTFLDRLAAGDPLPTAYTAFAKEPWETFLAEWPARFAKREKR